MAKHRARFWEDVALEKMSKQQWEMLCDGCAKCCLQKFEDAVTKEMFYTNIACDLLDQNSCRCTQYAKRSKLVPDCVTLKISDLRDPYWLPASCSYRLLGEGKPLPSWHPLVSGDPVSVVESGHSVLGRTVPATEADSWEFHLIDWVY